MTPYLLAYFIGMLLAWGFMFCLGEVGGNWDGFEGRHED